MTDEPITELEKLAYEMAEARREVISDYSEELTASLTKLQQPSDGKA